jgi:hypothetical protein
LRITQPTTPAIRLGFPAISLGIGFVSKITR